MSHDTQDWRKIWRKINFLFQNWQEFGEFWPKHYKVSKICTLIAPFRAKYIIFDLKKYRGVIFHDTEDPCKILRKTCSWFGKWHEDFGKLSPEHSKISKICTLMSCFWPKCKMFELKKYRGVIFNGTEHWCKIWRKTDLCFQKWREDNLANFHQSPFGSLKIWTFIGSFYPKKKIYELKFYRGFMCHDSEE